jgi:hypothetical protein
MSFMGIDFGDSESEEGEGKELEGVFEGGSIGDLGEKGVLLAGLGVCWRLKGSECAFDCEIVRILGQSEIQKSLTLKHVLPLSI